MNKFFKALDDFTKKGVVNDIDFKATNKRAKKVLKKNLKKLL